MLPLLALLPFLASTLANPLALEPRASALLTSLFPSSMGSKMWTTCTDYTSPRPLADSTFNPYKEIKTLGHPYVAAPDGKKSMKLTYPAGSFTFGNTPQGGVSFYAHGPGDVDLTTAKELSFGYSVYFPSGFAFVKGGKLPGIYGGDTEDSSVSCTGGSRSDACFSSRIMWRTSGAGELYTYLPPGNAANDKLCSIPPYSECNPDYGASIGRSSFAFATGAWTTVTQRIRLNDAGQANGALQLFVNGKSVVNVSGLVLKSRAEGRMRGMQMQSFFGGSDISWASPKDQSIYFSDFSIAILSKF